MHDKKFFLVSGRRKNMKQIPSLSVFCESARGSDKVHGSTAKKPC